MSVNCGDIVEALIGKLSAQGFDLGEDLSEVMDALNQVQVLRPKPDGGALVYVLKPDPGSVVVLLELLPDGAPQQLEVSLENFIQNGLLADALKDDAGPFVVTDYRIKVTAK